MRRLQQAVNNQVNSVRLPADPPVVNVCRTFTVVAPIIVVSDSVGITKLLVAQKPYTEHVLKVGQLSNQDKTVSCVMDFPASDINKMYLVGLGASGVSDLDTTRQVALVRAAFWGMLPQIGASSVKMSWDDTVINKCVVDHGSPTSRPKVGLSFPFRKWMDSTAEPWKSCYPLQAQFAGCSAWPSINGTPIGVIHLTIVGRCALGL